MLRSRANHLARTFCCVLLPGPVFGVRGGENTGIQLAWLRWWAYRYGYKALQGSLVDRCPRRRGCLIAVAPA